MALATRCPQCGTTFKVAHDQLKLRAGMVRCGACKQVFNGIEHLVRTDQSVAVSSTAASSSAKPVVTAHSQAVSATATSLPTTPAPAVSAPAPVARPAVAQSSVARAPVEQAQVAPVPVVPAPVVTTANAPAADLRAQNAPAKAVPPSVEKPVTKSAAGVEANPAPTAAAVPAATPASTPAPVAISKSTPIAAKSSNASLAPASLMDFSAPDSQFAKAEIAAKSGPVLDDTPRPSPSGIVFEPLILDDDDVAAGPPAAAVPQPPAPPVPQAAAPVAQPPAPPAPPAIADLEPHFDVEHVDAAPPPWDFTPGNTLPMLEQTTLANFPREEISAEKAAQVLAALDANVNKPALQARDALAQAKSASIEAAALKIAENVGEVAENTLEDAEPAPAVMADEEEHASRQEPHLDAGELADDLTLEEQRKHEELIRLAAEDSAQLASDTEEPGFVKRERRRRGIGRILNGFMLLSSILLTFGALGQASYVFRDQLAASVPVSKPWLLKVCALLSCQIGFPSQIKAVSLEGDELQTLPHLKNLFALSTLLRNHSNTVQSWPSIELSLNDDKDKVLARRVFAPRDYLLNPQDQARGFAAHGEQTVKLYFELNQIKASGYRVYLFYP